MPSISVLLPVRDAEPWLASSLHSLWRQTFPDFEVVAVDDGSRDGSGEALDRAAAREPRLTVIHTPPRGLPAALNTALAHARGTFIARHDADDLSHRERFRLQHAFLTAHPGVGVVGCRLRMFPARAVTAGLGRWMHWHNALLDHDAMRREALIDSPLAHGTALVRRAWLARVRGWRERGWAEDLDLWLRLFEAGARFAKLPVTLYGWRQHPGSSTWRDPRYARERFLALKLAALQRGPLRGRRSAGLVGVGQSLAAWERTLRAGGIEPHAIERARPWPRSRRPGPPGEFHTPCVLVFGAVSARDRWRDALTSSGMTEGLDFVFVA